jgi:hypothetical protein
MIAVASESKDILAPDSFKNWKLLYTLYVSQRC